MANLNVPLVPTSQTLSSNINEFKNNSQLIQFATPNVEDCPSPLRFDYTTTGGSPTTTWERTLGCDLDEGRDNLWAPTVQTDCIRVGARVGTEYYLICKVSLAEGRHFGPINQMGFEWYQSHSSNNSIFLRKFGLLYKKPRTDEQWSYSTDFNGESNKETTGYFFYKRNIGNFERDYQNQGYRLNEIYFQFRTTSGVGSAHYSYVELFNMRFGWGDGDPHQTTKICLPNIRPWNMAHLPSYGDA